MPSRRLKASYAEPDQGAARPAAAPDPQALARLQSLLEQASRGAAAPPAQGSELAREARDLAAALGRPQDQGQAAAWRSLHLLRLGRYAEALAEAEAALPLLRDPALETAQRDALRVATLAGSEINAFDRALDAAQELVRLTAARNDAGAALHAASGLAMCFERMGDSWQALRLFAQALDDHGAGAPEQPVLVATNGLCVAAIGIVHRLLDTGAEEEIAAILARARAAAERSRDILQRLPDPVYEVAILGNLGEVMLLQGEVAAAEPLLRRAMQQARQHGLDAYGWRVGATLGAWLLAGARPAEALEAMQRLLAEAGDRLPQLTAARAQHVAYRAACALGLHAQALVHLEQFEIGERRRVVAQLRAQSQLFVTRAEAQQAQWRADRARRDADAERQRAAQFAASAELDPLTGLGNRRLLDRLCAELLPAAEREGRPLALAQIDIDHFKSVNDDHGHAAGDAVLVAMAQLLRDNTRTADVIVRHGGEEFIVILPGMGLRAAAEVCERLRERVAAHPWPGLRQPMTISVGLTAAPPYDPQRLMQRADEALYRAKRAGRNRVVCAPAD